MAGNSKGFIVNITPLLEASQWVFKNILKYFKQYSMN
jgi:hypothetical protein